MSDSLWPHELQHARLPCPSLSPGFCLNSSLLSWWCYLTISSSVTSSFCLQCFQASGSFPMCWLFESGNQSIEASSSASVLPMNEYSGLISFRIDWFDLLAVQGTLKSLLQHHNSKASILLSLAFLMGQLWHPHMSCWKNHSFDYTDLCWQSDVSVRV